MPSEVTSTLDGLMSRWSTPRSWAWSRASASRAPHQAIARDTNAGASSRRPVELPAGRTPAGSSRSSASTRTAPERGGLNLGIGQDPRQRDAAEIGHAEQVQPGRRVDPVRVHRHDVGVLEPRQGLRLARAAPRHLERHRADRPAGVPWPGRPARTPRAPAPRPAKSRRSSGRLRETPGPRPPVRRWPTTREDCRRCVARPDQFVDLQDPLERGGNLGETGQVIRRDRDSPGLPPGGRTLRRSSATMVSSPRSG